MLSAETWGTFKVRKLDPITKIRKFLTDALLAHQIGLLMLIDLSGWSDMLASTTNELELFFQKDSKFLMDVFYWLIRSGSSC